MPALPTLHTLTAMFSVQAQAAMPTSVLRARTAVVKPGFVTASERQRDRALWHLLMPPPTVSTTNLVLHVFHTLHVLPQRGRRKGAVCRGRRLHTCGPASCD
jgi:hypothetical protein